MENEEIYKGSEKENKIFNNDFSNSQQDSNGGQTISEIEQLENQLRLLKAEKYKTLDLVKTETEGIKIGVRKNGKKYSVRDNRSRFFYPTEWIKFFEALNEKQKFTFKFLINTGCRINEARHIRVGDIDLDNKRIIIRITKVKAKKGEKNPKPRTVPISSEFAKYLKKVFSENKLSNECYMASSHNPKSKKDVMPENPKLFKDGIKSTPAGNICLKKTLKKIGIKEWMAFSLHNIRKTLENYLLALGINEVKISKHMGHDISTMIQHYVSADIFSFEEKKQMRIIIGDLYQQQF